MKTSRKAKVDVVINISQVFLTLSLFPVIGLLAYGTEPGPSQEEGPVSKEENGLRKIVLLPPGPGNPRNSEGDFVLLEDGRIMFVYSHFYAGRGGDFDPASLAARFSNDGGLTWSREDEPIIPNEGDRNVMSVSLLRLNTGEIAFFYSRINSKKDTDPVMRLSTDEGRTWSDPIQIIPDQEIGYYILNNDRVVQLTSGRLVAPMAQHYGLGWKKWDTAIGHLMCYLSDDNGGTWRRSRTTLTPPTSAKGEPVMLQEPGVVELKDGRLMMFVRTDQNCQYLSYSSDQGESWSQPIPSQIRSPRSPASIERIHKTGDLLLVWNDNAQTGTPKAGRRTPFNVALSKDEGKTWQNVKVLEDDPDGRYSYTAIDFVGDRVLLAHCAGSPPRVPGLSVTQITTFEVDWLYR